MDQFQDVLDLILREKGKHLDREIEVLEWLDSEINVIENGCTYGQGLFSRETQGLRKLVWDLRIVNIVLQTMQHLQLVHSEREENEVHPDTKRLQALKEGLENLRLMENRIYVCEKLVALGIAMAESTSQGLVCISEAQNLIKKSLASRLDENSTSTRFGTLFELFRHHPMALSCSKLSQISDPEVLFNFGNLFQIENDRQTKTIFIGDAVMLNACTVFYLLLEACYLKNMETNCTEDIEQEARVRKSVSKSMNMGKSFCYFAGINWQYRDAIIGLWLLDIQVETTTALELLARINLEDLFPSTNLSDFQVLNLITSRCTSSCDSDQSNKHRELAMQYYKLRGLGLVPKNADNALCMINVLLCNGSWKDALSLQRRLSAQLRIGDNGSKLQHILLEKIFSWILEKACMEREEDEHVEDGRVEEKLTQELLRHPMTLKEQKYLEEFLQKVSHWNKTGQSPFVGFVSTSIDREALVSLACDLLVAMNLLHYRLSNANRHHNDQSSHFTEDSSAINPVSSERYRSRESLLRYHNATLTPYGMPQNSRYLPFLGTLVENLPKQRMNLHDKLSNQRVNVHAKLPLEELQKPKEVIKSMQNGDQSLVGSKFGKKILHISKRSKIEAVRQQTQLKVI